MPFVNLPDLVEEMTSADLIVAFQRVLNCLSDDDLDLAIAGMQSSTREELREALARAAVRDAEIEEAVEAHERDKARRTEDDRLITEAVAALEDPDA